MIRQVTHKMILLAVCLVFTLAISGTVAAEENTNEVIAYNSTNINVNSDHGVLKTLTDENGEFTFDNLPNKTHVIWVNQEELPEEYRDNTTASTIALTLNPNNSSSTSFGSLTFQSSFNSGKIVGKLFETTTGTGIANITIYDPPQVKIFVIDGSYKVKQMVPAANNLLTKHPELIFVIRDYDQLSGIDENSLKVLLKQADIIYLGTMTSQLVGTIQDICQNNPDIFNGKTVYGAGGVAQIMSMSRFSNSIVFDGWTLDDVFYKIHQRIYAATNPMNEISKMKTEYSSSIPINNWLSVREYEAGMGSNNYLNTFLYLLNKHVGSSYTYQAPAKTPDYFIYRDGLVFQTFQEYQSYIDPQKPTIGVFGRSSTLYSAGETLMVDELIKKISDKGLNVLAVMGKYGAPSVTAFKTYFLDENQTSRIDVLISMESMIIGGRNSAASFQLVDVLEKINCTILLGMYTSSKTPEEWMISEVGLPVSEVHYRIAMPEVQGISEPIMIAALSSTYDANTGALLKSYIVIPDRVDKLATRASNWAKLKRMDNEDKKIAILYYNNPPGKNNIGASYLNVPETVLSILERLKDEGYITGEIPNDVDELVSMFLDRGHNVAGWAPGILEVLADKAILWDADEYIVWFNNLNPIAKKQMIEGPVGYIEEITKLANDAGEKKEIITRIDKWKVDMVSTIKDVVTNPVQSESCKTLIIEMADALKATVNGNKTAWADFYNAKNAFRAHNISAITGWGEPPGNLMTVTRNGKQYIVIPGLIFGNIFVGPEPLRGWEADETKLYHSTVLPPPHQFLAVYAWLENVYGANAEIHVGTHARFEWTPGKQTALADYDYPDITISNVPSPYIYIVDNIAEGQQAKRRGLSVLINHLTPPIKVTELYSELLGIRDLIEQYENADVDTESDKRKLIAASIREKVKSMNLDTDMNIELNEITDDDLVEETSHYLLEIQEMFMPYGLHTLGKKWTDNETAQMLASMASIDTEINTVKYQSLQRLIGLSKGINIDTATSIQKEQLNNLAEDICKQIVAGKTPEELATQLTSDPTIKAELLKTLNLTKGYYALLLLSFDNEMNSLMRVLSGGYSKPGPGSDPIRNPSVLPTGRNTYSIDAAMLPKSISRDLGFKLANMALSALSPIPEKIAAVLWAVETARDDGTMLSFILGSIGVNVTYYADGRRNSLVAIPLSALGRPRVDVVVTTSGLFRDLYGSLITDVVDRAFRVALAASYNTIVAQNNPSLTESLNNTLKTIKDASMFVPGDDPLDQNYVAKHWVELTLKYISKGTDLNKAGEMAITRTFTEAVGSYGNRVMETAEQAWTWDDRMKIADQYIDRMRYSYTELGWGELNEDLFIDMLSGVTTAYHSRSSNLYATLDNDDYLQYLGGLSMAIERVNGLAPDAYILYYANTKDPKVETLQHFMTREQRTRYFNPEWIKGMMNEGYSGARTIAQTASNLWGWEVTTPKVVENWMWDEMANTYVKDKYNIGVAKWLSTGNNVYAMISFTGTLLTAAHKGSWQTDSATLSMVANTWATMIAANGVACCDCSCGNIAMMEWASQYVNPDLLSHLNAQIYKATQNSGFAPSPTPSQPQPEASSQPQSADAASQSSTQSSAPATAGEAGEQSESQESVSPGEQGEAKAYEVSEQGHSGSSDSSLPAVAIVGVIVLVFLIGLGYFRAR